MVRFLTRILKKCGFDDELAMALSWMMTLALVCFVVFRVCEGSYYANDQDRCRVKSITDVVISPFYAIGCMAGKDRFDVRLN